MSYVYIFEALDKVSECYHENGACVIIADTDENAAKLASDSGVKLQDIDWDVVIKHKLEHPTTNIIFIFPDAGCC